MSTCEDPRSPTPRHFGPELEFFVFDHAWYDQGINYAKYYVGSREGIWGRGDEDDDQPRATRFG